MSKAGRLTMHDGGTARVGKSGLVLFYRVTRTHSPAVAFPCKSSRQTVNPGPLCERPYVGGRRPAGTAVDAPSLEMSGSAAVIISTDSADAIMRRAFNLGTGCHITKPITVQVMENVIGVTLHIHQKGHW